MGSEGKQLGRTGGELTSKPSSKKNRERLRSEISPPSGFALKVVRLMMVELVKRREPPCVMDAIEPLSCSAPSKWQLSTKADAFDHEEGSR